MKPQDDKDIQGKGEISTPFHQGRYSERELSVSRDPQSLLVAIRRPTHRLKATQVMNGVAYHQRLTHSTLPSHRGVCPKGLGEDSKDLPAGNDTHVLFSH